MEKRKPTEVGQGNNGIIAQLAQKAINAGYRVVPIKDGFPTGKFGTGQTYTNLLAPEWRGATAVGLILDGAVLLDYDGNKAEDIISTDTLAALLGLDILPKPVQSNKEGNSLHYLFKLPPGVVAGQGGVGQSADGQLSAHIDIKSGNQLMHLKPGKILGDLKPVAQLPTAPTALVDQLRNRGSNAMSYGDAVANLVKGSDVHGSARTVVNRLVIEGKSETEIWGFFEALRETIRATRGDAKVDNLFNHDLPRLIGSGVEKYTPPPIPFVEEIVPESAWDDWAYVAHDDKFFNLRTPLQIKAQAFDKKMMREDTFINDKRVPASKYAIDAAGIPVVDFAMYAPQFSQFFTHHGAQCLNLYKPETVPKAATEWSDVYQKHIELLFPFDHKIITQWMAWVARNPGKKVLWALLLKGVQGDGKTTIARMMKAAMGMVNTNEISMAELNSEFSGWSAGACLGIIEEIRISGQNRHKVMDKLKPLITNPEVSIVKKGVDAQQALNTMNYILLTNHEDALAIDDGDRRYGVFFTQFSSREELPDEPYWQNLHNAIENEPGGVRAWLESIDISDFDPKRAPALTEAKRKMMVSSRSSITATLAEALETGGLGVHPDAFNLKAVNILIDEMHLGQAINSSQITKPAEELGFVKWPSMVKWHGKAHRAYVRKGLQTTLTNADIRAMWETVNPFEEE